MQIKRHFKNGNARKSKGSCLHSSPGVFVLHTPSSRKLSLETTFKKSFFLQTTSTFEIPHFFSVTKFKKFIWQQAEAELNEMFKET